MSKRILRSGVLAVAVTLAFAFFANRVADWSRSPDAQMAAQLGTNPEPCLPPATEIVKVIPQLVLGSFDGGRTSYSTFILIVNTSGTAQQVSAEFYRQDGTALDSPPLNIGTATVSNGVVAPAAIAKDAMLVVSGGGMAGSGTIGWGRVKACGRVSVSTFFELRESKQNSLVARVGVASSPASLSSFVIPRIRESQTGLDVGFALVNTGTIDATMKVELKDAAGKTIAAKEFNMAGKTHQSAFTKDAFAPLAESGTRTYQYLKFTASSPTFAAVGLAFEGPTQTSFPVEILQ